MDKLLDSLLSEPIELRTYRQTSEGLRYRVIVDHVSFDVGETVDKKTIIQFKTDLASIETAVMVRDYIITLLETRNDVVVYFPQPPLMTGGFCYALFGILYKNYNSFYEKLTIKTNQQILNQIAKTIANIKDNMDE